MISWPPDFYLVTRLPPPIICSLWFQERRKRENVFDFRLATNYTLNVIIIHLYI